MLRLLAFTGSIMVAIYILGVLLLTAINVSRRMFTLDEEEGDLQFGARQGTAFVWPLMLISQEGRDTLSLIWNRDS